MAKKPIIPNDQYNLPVTFDPSGEPVTLREYLKPGHGSALAFASLPPEQRVELTVKRIEAQPKFELAMVSGGVVDKAQAIREVEARTDIGNVLIEIEQRVIANLLAIADR